MMTKLRKKTALPWLWISALVIVLDQLSKWWVVQHLPYLGSLRITPFLNITRVYNAGAAFSFLGNASGWQVYFFAVISLGVALLFIIWLARLSRYSVWRGLGLSLIIGGAIGNCIDRIRLQYVVDFIDFHIGTWHFDTFNVADSAVCIGAVLLIISFMAKEDY